MAMQTPLQQVKAQFGGKDKLVDKLMGLLDRGEDTKDEFRARLMAASNKKLMRLYQATGEIKERFGGKDKLVDSLLGLMNRAKDADYRTKLLDYTPSRLLDLYRSKERKSKSA